MRYRCGETPHRCQLFTSDQRCGSLLAFGDITRHPEPFLDLAVFIKQWDCPRARPSEASIYLLYPVLQLEDAFRPDGLMDHSPNVGSVVRMDIILEPVSVRFLGLGQEPLILHMPLHLVHLVLVALMRYMASELAVTRARKLLLLS